MSLYTPPKEMPKISSKNQVTLPVDALAAAGFQAGDEVSIEATGPETILIRRPSATDFDAAIGIFDGLYEPGYLAKLREEDWR
jgi:bifunctional DNA-binding transcriptional regulator/antitoxin component of YhaV-PrlF toxin-antitoxin module